MKLKRYVDLYALLEVNPSTREENRAFGLTHVLLKDRPLDQLLSWIDTHRKKLKRPLLSDTFSSYLYGVTLTLVLIAFVLGLLLGIGLLSYNGKEPVNVIYFMATVIFLPLFTMLLTAIAMLRARSAQSVLVHLSPSFWMEKILSLLPGQIQENIQAFKVNSLLANWVIIKRSQMIALFFSLGLLMALLGGVVTKDIAFAWSTTLHITPETFHDFLTTIALPWRDFVPSAVPSMELIEQSHYFRLGERLSEEMITHASELGEWWRFLAFATIFYAIFLRFLILLLSSFGLSRAVKESLFTLNGSRRLLGEINEPIISTHNKQTKVASASNDKGYGQMVTMLDASYDSVQGWAITEDELLVLSDSMNVIAPMHAEVGGTNTFEEDDEVISKSHGEVLLFVKAWEPPTMDFIDYLKDMTIKVDKVVVMPVGTTEDLYEARDKEIDVWENKLSLDKEVKVWLKRSVAKAAGRGAENAKS